MPMTVLRLLVLMLVFLPTGCARAPERLLVDDSHFLLGGIQVNEPEVDVWLNALIDEGMNTISVTDYASQGDWDTAQLDWQENTHLVTEIRNAKERGLNVVFIARVALDESLAKNRFLWHGMIMPKTDAQVHEWFDRYTDYVLHWARIAEREKIDVLMIGSELNALASTVPLSELPTLEEYFLNKEKQEQRRAQALAFESIVGEEHLTGKEQKQESPGSLEAYLDARIASEEKWAAQTALTEPRPDETRVEADARALAQINARRLLLEERWRRLIVEIRQVYGGRLGYAANFDQYQRVTFWDALDLMGINAYFQIRRYYLPEEDRSPERLYPMLEQGWVDVLADIDAYRREHKLSDQPVLFTELGYTFRANSTLNPWAHTGFGVIERYPREDMNNRGSELESKLESEHGDPRKAVVVWIEQPIDPTERALAIRALRTAHAQLERPFLEGLLYWKLSTLPSHREVEPFVLILGEEEEDPTLEELRRFN